MPENTKTTQRLGKVEFIALMAMMFATIAFAIDAMLPVLPAIAADISPDAPQKASLILTFFLIGMGTGTFFMGPLSDAFGRKPVLYIGLAIYALGALLSWMAPTLEMMLAARVLQGLGSAGPRVVSAAIIRDLYSGRAMASILSLTMMVFLLVPGIAPLVGSLIADAFGWRMIFAAFLMFSLVLFIWFGTRMRESLPVDERRPLKWSLMVDAFRQMLGHPTVRLSIIVQTIMMMILFCVLTMVQPIFEHAFDKADSFPIWFGAIAVISGLSSLLNASIVGRFGMRRLVIWALSVQVLVSGAFVLFILSDLPGVFTFYIISQFGVMFQSGLTIANLNAIAMEPMGHIAGMAASVIGSISTVFGAGIASLIGMIADPSPFVLAGTVLISCIAAGGLMHLMRYEEEMA